jgi:hypothetical protein
MQIKTTLRFHLIPVRTAIIKNTTNNTCWWGCGEKGTLVYCCRKCKLVQPLSKKIWRLLKNQNLDLHMIQQSHSWRYTQKNAIQVTPEAPCLLEHYSQYVSYANNQDAPLMMNGSRKCGICTQWNFTQPWRRMKSYHLQGNRWNWVTSFWLRLARLRRPKILCSPSYATLDLGQM